jgi:hypothetical protein
MNIIKANSTEIFYNIENVERETCKDPQIIINTIVDKVNKWCTKIGILSKEKEFTYISRP